LVFISFGCTNKIDFGSALRSFCVSVLVCPLQEVIKFDAKSKEQIDKLLPENVATSIVEKMLKFATTKLDTKHKGSFNH
jgi:hypothetical protein